jgi:hypothetical protein
MKFTDLPIEIIDKVLSFIPFGFQYPFVNEYFKKYWFERYNNMYVHHVELTRPERIVINHYHKADLLIVYDDKLCYKPLESYSFIRHYTNEDLYNYDFRKLQNKYRYTIKRCSMTMCITYTFYVAEKDKYKLFQDFL